MYDPEYQRQFQFEYVKSARLNLDVQYCYTSEIPKKCISFDQQQLVEMTVLSGIYSALSSIKFIMTKQTGLNIDIEPIVDDFLTGDHYHSACENLYTNWVTEQKFYFTKNFSGNPVVLSCDPMLYGSTLMSDNNFIMYIAKLLPRDASKKLVQLTLYANFKDIAAELSKEID